MHSHFTFLFFNATPTTQIYTLSLHDALPISDCRNRPGGRLHADPRQYGRQGSRGRLVTRTRERPLESLQRSEEHTSELQSRVDLVCRLLLEKKKKKKKQKNHKEVELRK